MMLAALENSGLLALWTHEYVDLFRDMAQPGRLWSRLKHLWKPPEWQRPVMDKNNKDPASAMANPWTL